MKQRRNSLFPAWPQEKLRRYDAAWARVFAGVSPDAIPRFSAPAAKRPPAAPSRGPKRRH